MDTNSFTIASLFSHTLTLAEFQSEVLLLSQVLRDQGEIAYAEALAETQLLGASVGSPQQWQQELLDILADARCQGQEDRARAIRDVAEGLRLLLLRQARRLQPLTYVGRLS